MASGGDRQNKMTDSCSTKGAQSGTAEIDKLLSAIQGSSDTTFVRIGQAGGESVDSTVTAVIGGKTTLPKGTKYFEAGQTGGITRGGGTTAATKDHTLEILPDAAAERDEPSRRGQGLESKVDQLTFGTRKTVALLLSGAGEGSDIFRRDVELMKTLLKSEKIGLSEDLLFSVWPKPDSTQTTKKQTKRAIDDIKKELKDSADNNFIFYYSGHFSKESRMLNVDERGDQSQNYYKDEDLSYMLRSVPAKHVLLILDMCYSGRANFGAKGGDGLPKTEDVGAAEVLAEVPRLWEFMTSRKGFQAKGDPVMIVQWSSSRAKQLSLHDQQSSLFTQAIVDVVTALDTNDEVKNELERGQTHATILQLNRQVVRRIIKRRDVENKKISQRPIIKPDHADAEYFKRFPGFAKVN